MTSGQRDTYVDIEGYGFDKINHAYAYGGAPLAIQTLNRNLDLDIEHYITVDFWAVEKIIDAIGGITLNVSQEELSYLNQYLTGQNQNDADGKHVGALAASGEQLLNGHQAVAYMRIRYVGNGDFERMKRQRQVIQQTLNQAPKLNLIQLIKLSDDLIPTLRTNLPPSTVTTLLTQVMKQGTPNMSQQQIPSLEREANKIINKIYYFVPNNLLTNIENLHKILYPEQTYEPTPTVVEINAKIESILDC